jgi:SET domain-containing protein
VFAAEEIPGGQDVIEYTGERVNRREAVRRHAAHLTYLMRLNSYWAIDGSRGGSGAEFVNHCCEPNLKTWRTHDAVWLRSLRTISKGEELALDYAFDPRGPRAACHCGAGSCRGTMNRPARAAR